MPRKMMCSTSPSLEINKSDSDEWTITTSTMFRTQVSKFRLGEEYEETMPGGVLKVGKNAFKIVLNLLILSLDAAECHHIGGE